MNKRHMSHLSPYTKEITHLGGKLKMPHFLKLPILQGASVYRWNMIIDRNTSILVLITYSITLHTCNHCLYYSFLFNALVCHCNISFLFSQEEDKGMRRINPTPLTYVQPVYACRTQNNHTVNTCVTLYGKNLLQKKILQLHSKQPFQGFPL